MTEQTNANNTTAPVVKTKREKLVDQYTVLEGKINELVAKRDAVVLEINQIDALASVAQGHLVIISVGKGEDKKDVEATVIGVKEDDTGAKLYKVTYGVGFDADVRVVKASELRLPPASEPILADGEGQVQDAYTTAE